MRRPIIEIKGLSKAYKLGVIGTTRLRDDLERLWAGFRGRNAKAPKADFWALQGVSFEVEQGEIIGIIGRNGAGKSTLLKILSRITQQTAGEVVLRGRVASLLEIGTGFHPDLTGRENIFLNGAILGMTRPEIKKKFDEIVAFAEIEGFIDTPAKRYSSGMYVRLAFAVAAHLEPEILVVDEVLAVGDVDFQRKCIRKMGDVASMHGRTILFVSHNLVAISTLCQRAVYLHNGKLAKIGGVNEVVSSYLKTGRTEVYQREPIASDTHSRPAWIRKAWIESDHRGEPGRALRSDETFTLNVELYVEPGQRVELIASFHDQLRRPLWTSMNSSRSTDSIGPGTQILVKQHYVLPPLTVDRLVIDLAIADASRYPFLDHILEAIVVPIVQSDRNGYRLKNMDFPLLVEPKQEVFILLP
jgi:ABC-type polysaccharide/polyol phosphate transport system ATPase subunit